MSCGVSPWLQVAPLALGDVPIVPSVSWLLPEGAPIPPRAPGSSLRLPVCSMSPTFQLSPFSWERCFPGLQLALCRMSDLGVPVLRPHVLRASSCRAAGAAAPLSAIAHRRRSRERVFSYEVSLGRWYAVSEGLPGSLHNHSFLQGEPYCARESTKQAHCVWE